MDDPKTQLKDSLKAAMLAKDLVRRDTIRLILNEIAQVEKDDNKELSPEEVLALLQKEAKKRRETIEEAQKSGHDELAKSEQVELAIIEGFLPQQMSREEIATVVEAAIAQTGASSPKEMGQVMGIVMPQVKGRADGKLVSQIVRELLGASS
ncbi:MAG: GatB/YqeY domain-containing protein [Chloroflexi bacterium]|nr:MAG: GatB/YqeY domain-containing protein [Chloroflexota bacterium]